MEPTLDQAIRAVFGAAQPTGGAKSAAAPIETGALLRAREHLNKAQKALQQGNWEDFGQAMQALQKALETKPPDERKTP